MFRAASNTLVDDIIVGLRRRAIGADVPTFSKGAAGAKAAMLHLKAGGFLGLLMDQKMNDGIAANLFGRPCDDRAGFGRPGPALPLPHHPRPRPAHRPGAIPPGLRSAHAPARHG